MIFSGWASRFEISSVTRQYLRSILWLQPFTRVTVPYWDYVVNDRPHQASESQVLVWTPRRGRLALTPDQYRTTVELWNSQHTVPLYEVPQNAKKVIQAERRNEAWRQDGDWKCVWDDDVEYDSSMQVLLQIPEEGPLPPQSAVLSIDSLSDLVTLLERGVTVLGTDLPRRWAVEGLALVDGKLDPVVEYPSDDTQPLRPGCTCYACSTHSRAYIQHLIQAKELLSELLLFVHNLHELLEMVRKHSETQR